MMDKVPVNRSPSRTLTSTPTKEKPTSQYLRGRGREGGRERERERERERVRRMFMLTSFIQRSLQSPRLLLVPREKLLLNLPPAGGPGEESDTWVRKKNQRRRTKLRKRSQKPHQVYLQLNKSLSLPRGSHWLYKEPHLLQGKGKPHPLKERALQES